MPSSWSRIVRHDYNCYFTVKNNKIKLVFKLIEMLLMKQSNANKQN